MISPGPKSCLIKAMYEWIIDNEDTPYIAIDAYYPDICVPRYHMNYIDFGLAFVDISRKFIQDLVIDDEAIA